MADPKKSLAALIVAKKPPMSPLAGPQGQDDEDAADGDSEGRTQAASEMLEAIQKNDSAALAAALKAFVEMC